jgi:hypothetical protein
MRPLLASAAIIVLSVSLQAFAAPGIATGLIKSVAELINLFRTDTTFTNKAITVSEDVVVSYVVEDLTNRGFTEDKGDGMTKVKKNLFVDA